MDLVGCGIAVDRFRFIALDVPDSVDGLDSANVLDFKRTNKLTCMSSSLSLISRCPVTGFFDVQFVWLTFELQPRETRRRSTCVSSGDHSKQITKPRSGETPKGLANL